MVSIGHASGASSVKWAQWYLSALHAQDGSEKDLLINVHSFVDVFVIIEVLTQVLLPGLRRPYNVVVRNVCGHDSQKEFESWLYYFLTASLSLSFLIYKKEVMGVPTSQCTEAMALFKPQVCTDPSFLGERDLIFLQGRWSNVS